MHYFYSADFWHIAKDDGSAYCGIAKADDDLVADGVPAGGMLHLECREAYDDELRPQAEADAAAAAVERDAAETASAVETANAIATGAVIAPAEEESPAAEA